MDLLFTKIFIESYKTGIESGYQRCLAIENGLKKENYERIEEALRSFIYSVLGFRFNGAYNLGEVRIYIDNICRNLPVNSSGDLIDLISEYKDEYVEFLETHPYVKMFAAVMKKIFSREYDGKLGNEGKTNVYSDNAEAILKHNRDAKSFIIAKAKRPTTTPLPTVIISNFDHTENVLREFVEAVKASDTHYNLFAKEGYSSYSEEEQIKMLFEGVILNATAYDLANIDLFFKRFTEFITDPVLGEIKGVNYVGEAFDDQLWFKVGKSDFEYETPYYLSFMLANTRLELPNVRIGLSQERNKAYIIAVQTSQKTGSNPEIDAIIKSKIPRTKSYNFYNPTHMTSLILAFGLLNGMGIQTIDVVDYMPLRYYKTIKDKNMNEQESEAYLSRVTDKNIYTYLKLECLTKGVSIVDDPGQGHNMTIKLDDEIVCHNEFFQELYDMAYKYGQSLGAPEYESRSL
ncbi:MAG: hypothetical protein IJO63_03725 [Bacilli bacterium]|nr:hypothetical protein [Bacilli bacterium]